MERCPTRTTMGSPWMRRPGSRSASRPRSLKRSNRFREVEIGDRGRLPKAIWIPSSSGGLAALEKPTISGPLEAQLRAANPWWEGQPGRPVLPYRRWPFSFLKRRLEDPLAPAVFLRGPRQVGKTTLQEQLIADLLSGGVPPTRIFRAQFDELQSLKRVSDPILSLSRWFEATVLGTTFNQAAIDETPAYLFSMKFRIFQTGASRSRRSWTRAPSGSSLPGAPHSVFSLARTVSPEGSHPWKWAPSIFEK